MFISARPGIAVKGAYSGPELGRSWAGVKPDISDTLKRACPSLLKRFSNFGNELLFCNKSCLFR